MTRTRKPAPVTAPVTEPVTAPGAEPVTAEHQTTEGQALEPEGEHQQPEPHPAPEPDPAPPAEGGDTPDPLEALRAELAAVRQELEALRPAAAELAELRERAGQLEQQRRQLTQAQRRLERLELERDADAGFLAAGGLPSAQARAGFLRLFGDQLGRATDGTVTLKVGKGAPVPIAEAIGTLAREDGSVVAFLLKPTIGTGSGSTGGREVARGRENLMGASKSELFDAFNE